MHLSDETLAAVDEATGRDADRAREHLATCAGCAGRLLEVERLRALLIETASVERRPRRDMLPGALKRLRLRRHGISNANEFLGGLAAFIRGFATLFAVAERGAPSTTRENDPHG